MIKIIKPSVEFLNLPPDALIKIERAGRTCYKSEDKISFDSSGRFIEMLIKRGHESVLEHASMTVLFIGSRAMSHQLVRHRIASYSQESQRYCNYNKSEELEVIMPDGFEKHDEVANFIALVTDCYHRYRYFVKFGMKPEDARYILPNCTKTEIVTTMNLRQWRHFLKVRTDPHAQEEIRNLANQILVYLQERLPEVVSDL